LGARSGDFNGVGENVHAFNRLWLLGGTNVRLVETAVDIVSCREPQQPVATQSLLFRDLISLAPPQSARLILEAP
jgi:hypothetical protein